MSSSTAAAAIVLLLTLCTEASPMSIALRGTNSSVPTGTIDPSPAIESAFSGLGADFICGMIDSDDSNATWIESGADQFLNDFILQNGDWNWVNKMAKQYDDPDNDGGNFNCQVIIAGGYCPPPTNLCNQYNPPEYFYIRQAVGNLYTILSETRAYYAQNAFFESLHIGQMVQEIGLPALKDAEDPLCQSKLSGDIAAGLTMASSAAGPSDATVGAVLGVLGGAVTSFDNVADCPDLDAEVETINANLQAILDNITQGVLSHLDDIANVTFGCSSYPARSGGPWCNNGAESISADTISSIGATAADNKSSTNVGQVFSDGRFWNPSSVAMNISQVLSTANSNIRQSLAGSSLKSTKVVLFVNTDWNSADACAKVSDTTFWSGTECVASLATADQADYKIDHHAIAEDVARNMTNYGVTMSDSFTVSDQCQTLGPLDSLFPFNLDFGVANLPRCFYSIPVLRGPDTPCHATKMPSWPQWLNQELDSSDCNAVQLGGGDEGIADAMSHPW